MSNSSFIAAINQICDEKNIDKEQVIETIKAALATAYKKDYGHKENEVEVIMNEDSDISTILLVKEVVKEIENPHTEISLEEAKKMKKDVEEGDVIKIDVTPVKSGYGRIAAQSAKQVILQRLQEAERDAMYEKFEKRQDEIVTGEVRNVEYGSVRIQIEKHTVMLSLKDQIPGERYFPGKRIKLYLDKVVRNNKGPQLLVSRTHKKLVWRLLEMEIPEIMEGEVKIHSIARDPGVRSKVAVWTEDEKIDPVGACIGAKGARIKNVMDELNGERVDIIEYSKDKSFIASALQPANVGEIIMVNDERAAIFVEEDQRPMAIGKKGQNIRLASELTGLELDVYNLEELPAFKARLSEIVGRDRRVDESMLKSVDVEAELKAAEASLKEEESETEETPENKTATSKNDDGAQSGWGGLSKAVIAKLEKAGYKSLVDLAGMDLKSLQAIEGIGKVSAEKILAEVSK